MDFKFDRRAFLKGAVTCSLAATGLELLSGMDPLGLIGGAFAAEAARPVIAVARDGQPDAMARAAVMALGGMGKFVKKGDVVLVKPNIGWDRTPEQAANTNPDVVRAVVKMCLEAGAKKVRVMDRPCNDPRRCYKRSGIKDAVESIGDPAVSVEHMDERKFVSMPIKKGQSLTSWTFNKDVLGTRKERLAALIEDHRDGAVGDDIGDGDRFLEHAPGGIAGAALLDLDDIEGVQSRAATGIGRALAIALRELALGPLLQPADDGHHDPHA